MWEFVFVNILMAAMAAVLYIAARALPRIPEEAVDGKRSIWERLIASEMPEKMDAAARAFTIKFLRRARVVLLRLENSTTGALHSLRDDDEKAKVDLGPIAGAEDGAKGKDSQSGPTTLLE